MWKEKSRVFPSRTWSKICWTCELSKDLTFFFLPFYLFIFSTYYDTNNDKKFSNVLGMEIMERRKDFGAN